MYPIEKRTMNYLLRVFRKTESFDYVDLLNAARPQPPRHMRVALEHLQLTGYLDQLTFHEKEKNRPVRITLSLQGIEYTGRPTRDAVLRWLTDNLVALLSLCLSIVALIASFN